MSKFHSSQFLGCIQLDAFKLPVVLPRLPNYHQILIFVYLQEALSSLVRMCPFQAVFLEVVDSYLAIFVDFLHVSPIDTQIERHLLHFWDNHISKCKESCYGILQNIQLFLLQMAQHLMLLKIPAYPLKVLLDMNQMRRVQQFLKVTKLQLPQNEVRRNAMFATLTHYSPLKTKRKSTTIAFHPPLYDY